MSAKQLCATALLSLAILLFSLVTPVAAFDLGVRGNFWIVDTTGDVQGNNTSMGSLLNLSDDLNLDVFFIPFGEAFLGIGRHRLSLGVTQYDQAETAQAVSDVVFDGKTFPGGSSLDANMRWIMFEPEYSYKFLDLENILAGFSVDGFVGGKYQEGTVSIESGNQKAEKSISWVRPIVGLQFHFGFLVDILEFRFKGGGMAFTNEHLVDALAEVSFTPFPFLDLGVGYRYFSVQVDSNGLEQDYDLKGPYAGLTLSF